MADVAATLAGWSSTTGSNAPSGGTTIGTGLDDNLREIQGVIVRGLSHKGADIASATTTDLGAVEGLAHDITGTTTITGFGTVRAGIWKVIKFEGALTLTHNATSLILPGAANITTADGDTAIVISEGSGNWRCVAYVKANGKPIAGASGAITSSDFTMSTARMLGRLTAATGAIEELTSAQVTTNFVDSATTAAAGKAELATQAEVDAGTADRVITSDLNRITIGTPATTTSGTAHDFTGIPNGVRRITISFAGVSLSGTDDIIVQLGDSGGFETTGYISSCGDMDNAGQSTASSTSGLIIRIASAARAASGLMSLVLLNSSLNLWACSATGKTDSGIVFFGGGEKALSSVLTQVRITVTGANTFDAGTVNIAYER